MAAANNYNINRIFSWIFRLFVNVVPFEAIWNSIRFALTSSMGVKKKDTLKHRPAEANAD